MNSDAGNPREENDFPDAVLKYIHQILMEEDLEEETYTFNSSALQAAEKSFHDILTVEYPSANQTPSRLREEKRIYIESSLTHDLGGHEPSCVLGATVEYPSQSSSQFNDGAQHGQTFLPQFNHVVLDFQNSRTIPLELHRENQAVAEAERSIRDHLTCKLREEVNPLQLKKSGLEIRSNKHLKMYADDPELPEVSDKILFSTGEDDEPARFITDEILQSNPSRSLNQCRSSGISGNGTNCRYKLVNNRMNVDLTSLLIHCAEAVADYDYRSANERLMQIKQYSSPFGDGSQRLAHYFAKALEARLAGTGSEVYAALAARSLEPTYMLKACRFFTTTCPFMKISNFFATQTVKELAEKASRIHIIHFGIMYGFQWPCLIQCLATRHGGPPVLRITGIDLPRPALRPAARVEEAGRYLAIYCERFGVPFEYNAIAQKWENIQFEDLKIDRNEVTVVNCLYRLRYLLDETVVPNSPRDAVLNLIKRINPDVFIHGIINGAYNAPFFMSRFREALFYFSAVFDMIEANASRENCERMVFEEEIYAREIMNVIACEGTKRIERPMPYKQWWFLNTRAGFRQLPLDQEMMKKAKAQVKLHYHKDFLLDEDGQWMLQGWKGRILFAISCWKPSN